MFFDKLSKRLKKMRLQPIRVFCFHHVSRCFDEATMHAGDWTSVEDFKQIIDSIKKSGAQFISLKEAYKHICSDMVRSKKYAVLTFDDGYKTLQEILPWLEDNKIPATLFVNGKYLDGMSYRENPDETYLTEDDLFALDSSLIEVAHHGWEHLDMSVMSRNEFETSIKNDLAILSRHPRCVPFCAYTYGRYSTVNMEVLKENNIVPVLTNGGKNYNDKSFVDREIRFVPGKW